MKECTSLLYSLLCFTHEPEIATRNPNSTGQQTLWFNFDKINQKDEKSEVLRVNKVINEKGETYVTASNERHFIVMKVPLEEIGNKAEVDDCLHKFSAIEIEQTKYPLLIGE